MVKITLIDRVSFSISLQAAIEENNWIDQIIADGYEVVRHITDLDRFTFHLNYSIDFPDEATAAIFKLTYL